MSRMTLDAVFMVNSISFRSSTILFSFCVWSPSVAATCRGPERNESKGGERWEKGQQSVRSRVRPGTSAAPAKCRGPEQRAWRAG